MRLKISFIVISVISLLTMSFTLNNDKPGKKFSGKYDIGGYKLFLSSMGRKKPAVILESGFGEGGTRSGWEIVQKKVSKFAKVCLYDRAGLGLSDEGPGPRTTIQIAEELHALLRVSHIEPPYILVGHSMGGLHIQTYAMLYPGEIAAMVFVDPSPEEIIDTLATDVFENLVSAGASGAVMDETGPGLNASIPVFKSLPGLPDVPVVVITSAYNGENETDKERWEELKACHQKLSDGVTDGRHVVASRSGHYIQINEPELVIDAIKSVCDKVRK